MLTYMGMQVIVIQSFTTYTYSGPKFFVWLMKKLGFDPYVRVTYPNPVAESIGKNGYIDKNTNRIYMTDVTFAELQDRLKNQPVSSKEPELMGINRVRAEGHPDAGPLTLDSLKKIIKDHRLDKQDDNNYNPSERYRSRFTFDSYSIYPKSVVTKISD